MRFLIRAIILMTMMTISVCYSANNEMGDVYNAPILTGTFMDDPVNGLFYQSKDGNPSGYTKTKNGKVGQYDYQNGEIVEFYLGDKNGIFIGSTKGKSIVTPIDLVPGAHGPDDIKVNNIAYLLQMFGNSNGKIIIPQTISFRNEIKTAQKNKPINFASATFATDIENGLMKAFSPANKPNIDPNLNVDSAKTTLARNVAHAYFSTSLHGTSSGMKWWFNRGIGKLIGASEYDQLGCSMQCHSVDQPAVDGKSAISTCESCHESQAEREVLQANGKPLTKAKDPKTCLGCHGRQGLEMNDAMITMMGMEANTDVHRTANKVCVDCHTFNEIHGTGIKYNSMHSAGKMERDCTSCHKLGKTKIDKDAGNAAVVSTTVREHEQHTKDIHCSSCHTQTMTTCYNCHLDSSKQAKDRVFVRPFQGFVILGNDKNTGKVTPVSYMANVGKGKTSVAFGSYYNHAIQSTGRTCVDCHNNERMKELANKNEIIMTSMNGDKLEHTQGVIPFVPKKMKFLFMDHQMPTEGAFNMMKNPGTWMPLGSASFADIMHYEFIAPLNDNQIDALQKSYK